MLEAGAAPTGVMDVSYAEARTAKPHLAFRLRVRARVVARAVRKYLPPEPVSLLEVGAAEGRTMLEMAAALGPGRYAGVEFDPGLIAAAPSLPSDVSLVRGDAMSLPEGLVDHSFDVVSMLALLEHLPDPSAALAEARRMLRPGGLIVATCPNPFWDEAASKLGLMKGEHHVEEFDLKRLREIIAQAGFDVLEARRFMWAPLAILPYGGIPVGPGFALGIDALVGRIPLVNTLCVNAFVIGQLPKNQRPY